MKHHGETGGTDGSGFVEAVQVGEHHQSCLQAALLYAKEWGWHVLPVHAPVPDAAGSGAACTCSTPGCAAAGKHPRTRHGMTDATTDPAKIRQWWRQWPNANIGIRTGRVSNLLVIDIDPRNGGDETLAALQQRLGCLPRTVEAHTGGGGQHLLFRYPKGVNVPSGLGDGIDLKGEGGFIVTAPSVHASGGIYEWVLGHGPEEHELAELPPAWTAELERQHEANAENAKKIAALGDSSVFSVLSVFSVTLSQDRLIDIVMSKQFALTGTSCRHKTLLSMVLGLKGLAANPDLLKLIPTIRRWHRANAGKMSGTHSEDDTVDEFKIMVRTLTGSNLFTSAWLAAEFLETPPIALEQYTDQNRLRLATVCRWMSEQRAAHGGVFSLSARQVAAALGDGRDGASREPMDGWRILDAFARDGLLERVTAGKAGVGGKDSAATWRWIGGDHAKETTGHKRCPVGR